MRRWAGIAGMAFVVLLVLSIVLVIPAPSAEKSAAKIVKWYTDNRELALAPRPAMAWSISSRT